MPTMSFWIPEQQHQQLKRLKTSDKRSASNMVAFLIDSEFSRRFAITSVSLLPGPADAERPLVVIVQDNEVTK